MKEYLIQDGILVLRSHHGSFYWWSGTCWPGVEDRALVSVLYRWLEHAVYEHMTQFGPELRPWAPTKPKIGNVVDALHAATHLHESTHAPTWLDGHEGPAVAGMVALVNGLLDLRSRELIPHTPAFFNHHALPFAFDPNAGEPTRWNGFLHELWADDQESIDTLAEVFGYILGGATDQQKLFMLIGPKRSGKGTIGRVLTGLLGAHNTTAPTLSSLTTNFGISPLI